MDEVWAKDMGQGEGWVPPFVSAAVLHSMYHSERGNEHA